MTAQVQGTISSVSCRRINSWPRPPGAVSSGCGVSSSEPMPRFACCSSSYHVFSTASSRRQSLPSPIRRLRTKPSRVRSFRPALLPAPALEQQRSHSKQRHLRVGEITGEPHRERTQTGSRRRGEAQHPHRTACRTSRPCTPDGRHRRKGCRSVALEPGTGRERVPAPRVIQGSH